MLPIHIKLKLIKVSTPVLIKVIYLMADIMEREKLNMATLKILLKAIGSKENFTEVVFISGIMETSIKVNGKKVWEQEKEKWHMPIKKLMKADSRKIKNTEKEFILIKMEKDKKEYGQMR